MVGPVPVGINKFILQTDAPDPTLIPESDLIGITVILVTCSYREQEFARVGYYVNNEYRPFEGYNVMEHGEIVPESPIDLSKVFRTIVADKPRVTRFPIQWSGCLVVSGNGEGDAEMEIEEEEEGRASFMSEIPSLCSPEKSRGVQHTNVVSPDSNSNQSSVMVE